MVTSAAAMLLPPSAASAAAPATGPACELHVTPAGYPGRSVKGNALVKVQAPPLGGAVFTATNVAAVLDEAQLQTLLPGLGPVTVIRHSEMIDLDQRKLDGKAPLHASEAGCYADLVIDNIYAIFSDSIPQERLGLVGGLIVGNNRMIASFWLQLRRDPAVKPMIYKKKFDSPLRSVVSDLTSRPDALRGDMIQATADSLRQFAEFVAGRTKN